ncbi:MAG: MBL fold metallo-hydrolase [Bacillota bacterium]|nr:MBL fold metallo-hydrolase [Bacillota bacterium]
MEIYQIASGSSGNVMLFSSEKTRFLLDAGTNARYITKALAEIGVSIGDLSAIVLTHEHSDHISALRGVTKNTDIPVYASSGTTEALIQNAGCKVSCIRPFRAGSGFYIGDFYLESFEVSHDACDCVGYTINCGGEKTGYATDLGCVNDRIISMLKGSRTVIIESNHDPETLKKGPYPYYLKRRILSDSGHLSNQACAEAALEFAKNGARKIILSHLSAQNNTAEMAFNTTYLKLLSIGAGEDVELIVAKRR